MAITQVLAPMSITAQMQVAYGEAGMPATIVSRLASSVAGDW